MQHGRTARTMTDVEKVKQGLNHCFIKKGCYKCPYWEKEKHCSQQLCKDALSVIEEQQAEIEQLKPKEGHWIRTGEKNCYGGTVAVCSCCEDKIVFSDISLEKYCRSCGAKMGE